MNEQATPSPHQDSSPSGPVREHERIVALDVLRGVALFGVLLINISLFGLTMGDLDGPSLSSANMAEGPIGEIAAWAFLHVVMHLKFVSIFSLLFGIGLAMAMDRARQRNQPFVFLHLRRLFFLGLIGLSSVVIWAGDILFFYAVIGSVLLVFSGRKPRTMLVVGSVAIVLGTVVVLALNAGLTQQAQAAETIEAAAQQVSNDHAAGNDQNQETVATNERPRGFEAMEKAGFDPRHPAWMEAETRAYKEGPFADVLPFRIVGYLITLLFITVAYSGRMIGLFLIGAAIMRMGFFRRENARWQKRVCVAGFAIGLPLELAAAGIIVREEFTFTWAAFGGVALHEIGSYFLCAGYVGALTLLVNAGRLGMLKTPFAAVGRMPVTNFLLIGVLGGAVFYWWGLGLYGEVSRTQALGIGLVLFAVQVAFSTLWMRMFRFGPVEWLWRSLTYLKPQPLLRR